MSTHPESSFPGMTVKAETPEIPEWMAKLGATCPCGAITPAGHTKSCPNRPVGGDHKDAGKTRLDLVDAHWIEATGRVLGFGAEKYDPWNWTRGIAYTRLLGSALRHLFAFARREDLDPESGLPHLAHASCCLMMLYGMTVRHPELDDRVEGV